MRDEIKWLTTAGDEDLRTSDDFVAKWEGYMLRVECMDTRVWWWEVYFPDGTRIDDDTAIYDFTLTTAKQARKMAEVVARVHRRALLSARPSDAAGDAGEGERT